MTLEFMEPWPENKPLWSTGYRDLLTAEAGPMPYNFRLYPAHGISNNVLRMVWGQLLADSVDGVVLTERGRDRLAGERAARPSNDEDDESESNPPEPQPLTPQQLDLFALT